VAEKQRRRRLFLALWPDDITRRKLADIQQQFGNNERLKTAKPVAVGNLHITAHFIGAVTEDVHTRLETLLSGVKAQSCTLVIDRWGYFPGAKVLWLGARAAPAALSDLVEQTQTCIQQCVDGYEQKRFVPHITVFRKARHPMEVDDFPPIEWNIDRFALVESVTHPQGPEYTVLKEWMLS
jgi:2'-5' RNA ligase